MLLGRENVPTTFQALIGPRLLTDKRETELGWLADAYPVSGGNVNYAIAFNHPLPVDEYDYISQFVRDGHADTIRKFYRQCNGWRIFRTFTTPGVITNPEGRRPYDFNNIPVGFASLGGHALPPLAPISGFQIARLHEKSDDGTTKTLHDLVDRDGRIIGGYFDSSPDVLSVFEDLSSWLGQRLPVATSLYRSRLPAKYFS